ncbi:hypothetical protein CGCSCA2_v014286 [Colletotrichum siamense]|uniref:Uncharacterized protein n=1 Tax=Colletotrichum siamense TaxID=690259 RepID=A0A9P5EHV8_COLSI|nr:hypothetical protein CGCSCA2_v014286 [Colletotrichum siamense]
MPGIDPTKDSKPFLCACLPKSPSKSPTPTPPAKTTSAPPVQWTGSCNEKGGRFEKDRAKEIVEKFCEVAFENEWSDEWFAENSRTTFNKDIIFYSEFDQQVWREDFEFVIKVSIQSHKQNEPQGEGSDLNKAMKKLREDVSVCEKEFGHLIKDCEWVGKGPNRLSLPAGGSRPSLCMVWELYADMDD